MWGHQHNDNPTEEERHSPRFLQYYDANDILLLFDEKNLILGICSLKSQGKKEGNGEISDLLMGPVLFPPTVNKGFSANWCWRGSNICVKGEYTPLPSSSRKIMKTH